MNCETKGLIPFERLSERERERDVSVKGFLKGFSIVSKSSVCEGFVKVNTGLKLDLQ